MEAKPCADIAMVTYKKFSGISTVKDDTSRETFLQKLYPQNAFSCKQPIAPKTHVENQCPILRYSIPKTRMAEVSFENNKYL